MALTLRLKLPGPAVLCWKSRGGTKPLGTIHCTPYGARRVCASASVCMTRSGRFGGLPGSEWVIYRRGRAGHRYSYPRSTLSRSERVTVATIEIDGDDAVLKLGRMEDVEAEHIHTISAPLSAIQSVKSVDDPWSDLRGVKEVGTEIPNKIMVGTRRGEGFKDFCAVHKAGPAVIVTLDPAVSEYNRWVVSADINDVPAQLKR